MATSVIHNEQEQSFYATVNGYEAELTYSKPTTNTIDFNHTYVDENLRGQGVGEEMARAALQFARDQKFKVHTSCRFVASFIKRHEDEYKDLVTE